METEEDLPKAIKIASTEAAGAFGNGEVYLEKYLTRVKHVEVQLLCDEHGNCITLGERDCSVQRKNQKIMEESPCATLPDSVRERMFAAARKAAQAVGYTNAGTVEFLYDGKNE